MEVKAQVLGRVGRLQYLPAYLYTLTYVGGVHTIVLALKINDPVAQQIA